MNTKRNWKRWLAVFAMLSALMLGSIIASAASGDTVTVKVTGKYGQTEARSMLKMINDFRTGDDAWYYTDDTKNTKYNYNTNSSNMLSKLEYDYGLEQAAMQRAVEIALSFSHTRPDGTDCFTITPSSYGENIAAGHSTAASTFVQWQETEYGYSGQGHRINMLDPDFKYIGIAHIQYENLDYWVQEFGFQPTGISDSGANDSKTAMSVNILESNIKQKEITASEASLEIPYGDSIALPGIGCEILLNAAWPGYALCPVTLDSSSAVWTVESGSDCVSIDSDSGEIIGMKCGEAKISTTIWGETVAVDINVTPKPIDDAVITLDPNADLSYTGSEITPEVSEVLLSGTPLKKGVDYSVSYSENTEVGTATVTITGIGNYVGTATATFDIIPAELTEDNSAISAIEDQPYTGSEIKPAVTVTRSDVQLSDGDYEVSYENNIDAGEASVTVTGTGNYTGTVSAVFQITPADLSECIPDDIPDQDYTGKQIKPEVSLQWNDYILEQDTDYTVSYGDNTNVGTASVTIKGTGNFSGTLTEKFQILPADLSDCTVEEIPAQTYCGKALTPDLTVSLGTYTLSAETDYVAEYSNNTEVGTASVTLSVPDSETGNFTGTKEVTFEILPIDLEEKAVSIQPIDDQVYTGSLLEPEVVVELEGQMLKADTDYTVDYENNQNAGTASVTVKGTGNYTGTLSADFTILPVALSDEFKVSIPNQPYTGAPVEPSVSIQWGDIELVEGKDFSVECTGDHTDAGTVELTISGTGNYSGEIEKSFKILQVYLTDCSVSPIRDQTYTGAEIFAEFTVSLGNYKLIEGKDYTASYDNNIELTTARSKAEIMLYGQGNFKGSRSLTFNIVPINLVNEGATIQAIEDQTYSGEAITPEVTVVLEGTPLTEETDYEVSYSNNTDAGTAKVTVVGQGNYTGELSATFRILPMKLAADDCTLGEIAEQTYTGAAITPAVTVMLGEKALKADVDYTVSYRDNKNAGEATAIVTAAGNYKGELGSISFTIMPADLADCTVEPIADQTYTGSSITPAVTVRLGENTLVEGEDYTVSYEKNVEIGTATVTLNGIGNYTGTYSLSFAIVAPPATTPDPSSPDPNTPGSNTPGSNTPGSNAPGSNTPAANLVPGTMKEDPATGTSYWVTKSSSSEVTVEYMAPANKKKTTVTIPDVVVIDHVPCKVTSIAANAFKNNKKLKKVVVGKYVTSIGKNAFRGCPKLTTVKLDARISKIGTAAFYGCTSLKSVTIPANVKTIGKQAFFKCTHLKKITIKTKKLTTKSVGKNAFSKISNKAVIKVPASKKKAYRTLLKKRGVRSSAKIK